MKNHARLITAFALLLSVFALPALAQTFTYWTGTGVDATDFNAADNWNPAAPDPTGTINQFAAINSGTVSIGGAATGYYVLVGNEGGTASLNIGSGKSLTVELLSFGVEEGSSGTGTISGTVTATSLGITVGDQALFGPSLTTGTTGNLTISSGGTVNGAINIGYVELSTGTLVVTGSGSTVTGGIYGGSGTATITVDDSATVQNGIFGTSGSTNITITGSAVVNGGLGVGNSGAGTSSFTVDNGSTLGGNGEIGVNAGTGGTATGSIEGSMHTVDRILVGGGGTNTLTVTDATLDGSGAGAGSTIGYTGGTSTFVLSDAVWNNSNNGLNVGRNGGTGVFTLDTNSTSGQGETHIGRDTGSNGTINVTTGSTLNVYGALRVGSNIGSGGGTGTLAISGGSTVNSKQGYVGNGASTTGTVTISGSGSSWAIANSGVSNFEVGSSGTGTLTVSAGATLTNDSIATVGSSSGSNGSVIVTGTGSSWTSASTITVSAQSGATGSITLADGGALTITSGLLRLAEGTGAGTLNIGAAANLAAAAPGTLNLLSGSVRSVGSNGTVVFNHTSSSYVFDDSLEFGLKVHQKAGTTTLSGAVDGNIYQGGTSITGGILKLGADGALGSGGIHLGGGTLDLNDFDEAAGALNLTASSFLDFSGISALALADSSALAWSGTLTVLDFDGSDSFRVGTDGNGLTSTQLSLINIGGFIAQIDGSGYVTASAIAVPEPATYALLAGVGALAVAAIRRRRAVAVIARY